MAMTNEKVVEAAQGTLALVERKYNEVDEMEGPGEYRAKLREVRIKIDSMIDPLRQYLAQGRREKAMRHLGFMQGVAWACGAATVDDLKRLNMPERATFDAAPSEVPPTCVTCHIDYGTHQGSEGPQCAACWRTTP